MLKNFTALLLSFLAVQTALTAQSDERMSAILYLCGAESEEDLDEQEVEQFSDLASHPLEINLASRNRLISSGLFSQFQAASLIDYRSRNGDVLSVSELAEVEGFGEDYANALKPFVSFVSTALPGQAGSKTSSLEHEALFRFAVKDDVYNYGVKYRMDHGDSFGF